jgi:glutamate/tyrosine decarboxylase-like PLP-dependent enzyme
VEEEIMDSALKKHDSSQCPYCEVIFSWEEHSCAQKLLYTLDLALRLLPVPQS